MMNEASTHQQIVYTQACCIKRIIYIYGVHASSGSLQTGRRESVISAKAVAREFNGYTVELGSP
jgi:hypothetical protein